MTDFHARDHDVRISRDLLTDLWRGDCPTCGPIAIGQVYRADVVATAARHRDTYAVGQSGTVESAPELVQGAPGSSRGQAIGPASV